MAAASTNGTAAPQHVAHPLGIATTGCNTTILQLILHRLSQQDACNAAQVCKEWLASIQYNLMRATLAEPSALHHVTTTFVNLEHLTLHGTYGLMKKRLQCIAQLQSLQSLTLGAKRHWQVAQGLEVLASMRTLVHLALCNMVLPLTSGLSHLVRKGAAHQDPYAFSKSQGALLHLTLHACHTGGATLEELLLGGPHGEDGGGGLETNSPQQHGCQLQVLDLSESTYACKGLGMLTSLHTLIMRDAGELDDKVCYEIAKLTQLRSLDLTRHGARAYNNKMTNKGMEALCSLPHLQSLVLHGYARLKNTTAMMLCNLSSSLTHLDLEHVPEMQFPRGHVLRYMYEIPSAPVGNMFDFTSEGVQHMVKGLPCLQSLVLSGPAVDSHACRAIAHALPTLTSLKFSQCGALTDSGLCFLEPLTTLRTLSLVNCDGVTDIAVARVMQACRWLQHVELAHVPGVTPLSLKALHGLPLRRLNLSGNLTVTDEVLAALVATCPLLETLVLEGCCTITDAGLFAIAQHALQLKHLNVQHCFRVGVPGLRALAALPRLHFVNAYGCVPSSKELGLHGVDVVVEKPTWWMR